MLGAGIKNICGSIHLMNVRDWNSGTNFFHRVVDFLFFCQSLGESTLWFLHDLKWKLIIWGSVAEPQIIQVSFGFLTLLALQVPGGFWVALLKQVFSSCAPCLGRGPRKITAPWKKIFRKVNRMTSVWRALSWIPFTLLSIIVGGMSGDLSGSAILCRHNIVEGCRREGRVGECVLTTGLK